MRIIHIDSCLKSPLSCRINDYVIDKSQAICKLTKNRIEGLLRGIVLSTNGYHSSVTDNLILPLPVPPSESLNDLFFSIVILTEKTRVENNTIHLRSPYHGGIDLQSSRCFVHGNRIQSHIIIPENDSSPTLTLLPPHEVGLDAFRAEPTSFTFAPEIARPELNNRLATWDFIRLSEVSFTLETEPPPPTPPIGIRIGGEKKDSPRPSDENVIEHRLLGHQIAIWARSCSDLQILQNHIGADSNSASVGMILNDLTAAQIKGNTIRLVVEGISIRDGVGNLIAENRVREAVSGILFRKETDITIKGNEISDIQWEGLHGTDCTGRITILDNQFTRCAIGTRREFNHRQALGFVRAGPHSGLEIQSCRFIDTGQSPFPIYFNQKAQDIFAEPGRTCVFQNNRVSCRSLDGQPHKIELLGGIARTGAQISNNHIQGGIQIRAHTIDFSHNLFQQKKGNVIKIDGVKAFIIGNVGHKALITNSQALKPPEPRSMNLIDDFMNFNP